MAKFKSEEQFQLIECEEDLFESSDKLISHGINVGDVNKFQDAGIYTCNGLMMQMDKRKAVVGITTGSPALDELMGGKLFVPISVVGITTGQALDELMGDYQPLPDDNLPPLTPKLLLVHPNRQTCELFDPKRYEALTKIKALTADEIQQLEPSDKMLEEIARINQLTLPQIQKLATYEIHLDLKGFRLVGSFPGGWLLLLSYATQSFHLCEMTGKWHTLLVDPELTTNKNFMGVCDGVENVFLLEMENNDIVIHTFQIQGCEIVIHHDKFQSTFKGRIRNALLHKNILYLVVSIVSNEEETSYIRSIRLDSVGGRFIPRTSDLEITGSTLKNFLYTSMVLSPLNMPLLIVFSLDMQFEVFEVFGDGDNLYIEKVSHLNMLYLQLYLAPNAGGCAVQEENTTYLATHSGTDCLKGTTEINPDYEADDEEADDEEQEQDEEYEADEEEHEPDEEVPDEEAEADEEAVLTDEDFFTVWTQVKACQWYSVVTDCPCPPVWVMLDPIQVEKLHLAPPSYIG